MKNKEFNIDEWRKHHIYPLNEDQSSDNIFNAILVWLEDQKDDSERFETAYDVFKDYERYIKMEIIKAQSNG